MSDSTAGARHQIAVWAIVVFLLGSFAVALGYGGYLFGFLRMVPGADKTGHFVVFAVFSTVVNLGFAERPLGAGRLGIQRVSALILLAATLEEQLQRVLPERTFDYTDLSLSYLGTIVGAWVAHGLLLRLRSSPLPEAGEPGV